MFEYFSISALISYAVQPHGGYLKPSSLTYTKLNDGREIKEGSVISPQLITSITESMVNIFIKHMPVDIVFSDEPYFEPHSFPKDEGIHMHFEQAYLRDVVGAEEFDKFIEERKNLRARIKGFDDDSIRAVSKFSGTISFNPGEVSKSDVPELDDIALHNIKVMLERYTEFLNRHGDITSEYSFRPDVEDAELENQLYINESGNYGGYSASTIGHVKGEDMTKDTIWKFIFTKSKPNAKHTLSVLTQWVMAKKSGSKRFKDVTKIGIFDAKYGCEYTFDVNNITQATIQEIEKIIGY